MTSLTEEEEREFLDSASRAIAGLTGLEPLLGFSVLPSITIFPVEADVQTLLQPTREGNVVRESTEVRNERTGDGTSVTRFLRREADDRGDFTYDMVYVPYSSLACSSCQGFIVRMVKFAREGADATTPSLVAGHRAGDFEAVFRSFAHAD